MDIIGDGDEPEPARPEQGPAGWRVAVRPADALHALSDGLIALGSAVVVALLSLVILVYSAGGPVHGGPGDFFAVAVWLTGASLGVPVHESTSVTVPGGHELITGITEARAIAWLLTAIVLVLVFRLVRRRQRALPGADPAKPAVQALLTSLVVTLGLLVLALTTTRSSVFGLFENSAADGTRINSTIGLEAGFVFAGPLLLTAAAAVAGAAPWRQRAAAEVARWSPVLRMAWRQALVIGILAGVTLLIYSAVELGQHSGARETAVIIIGLVLLLPNLAIYGTLGGFGTTFYGTAGAIGSGLGRQSGVASHSIGVFGSFRPWIVWLLLGAAVAGTLLPAVLARRGRPTRRPLTAADFPLAGVWRAAVAGLLTAAAVVLLGAFSETITDNSSGVGGSVHTTASAGPSLLAAAGLTAAWLSLGYLATSVAVHAVRGTTD